jgi:CotS family spore coat protein
VEYGDGIYIVLDLIDGRDCVFENPLDLSAASKALGNLHEAGRLVEVADNKRNNLCKMIDRYVGKITDMKKFKDIAIMHKNKSDFDIQYIKYCDFYIDCGLKALNELIGSPYIRLCGEYHTLCHHDLAHHNLLIDDNSNVHFIDFDYALLDCPYHDISNLITKAIKHNEWNIDIAENIIESYSSVRKLEQDELKVTYAYLMFPQDFYDIATSYYMKARDWEEDEFAEKLRRKAEYKEAREGFLDDFYKKWIEVH